jgi:hypothetical protein
MKTRELLLLGIATLIAMPRVVSAQTAHLTLQGDPGEALTGGRSYDETYTPNNTFAFSATVEKTTNGLPSFLDFVFFSNSLPNAILDFSTDQLGQPLLPGSYSDAERAPFAQPGHPGLWVAFNNGGPNTVSGDFTIQDAIFAPDPTAFNGWRVLQFDATFEQHSDGQAPALHGSLSYSAVSVPEPSTWALLLGGGMVLLAFQRVRSRRCFQ